MLKLRNTDRFYTASSMLLPTTPGEQTAALG